MILVLSERKIYIYSTNTYIAQILLYGLWSLISNTNRALVKISASMKNVLKIKIRFKK